MGGRSDPAESPRVIRQKHSCPGQFNVRLYVTKCPPRALLIRMARRPNGGQNAQCREPIQPDAAMPAYQELRRQPNRPT
jgi:hypothetical protein